LAQFANAKLFVEIGGRGFVEMLLRAARDENDLRKVGRATAHLLATTGGRASGPVDLSQIGAGAPKREGNTLR
jgi:hypothetical protein